MNIIEAIKSKQRFRRPNWPKNSWQINREDISSFYTQTDILADDWEIEEKKIDITFTQLQAALDKVISIRSFSSGPQTIVQNIDWIAKNLAAELGLL